MFKLLAYGKIESFDTIEDVLDNIRIAFGFTENFENFCEIENHLAIVLDTWKIKNESDGTLCSVRNFIKEKRNDTFIK